MAKLFVLFSLVGGSLPNIPKAFKECVGLDTHINVLILGKRGTGKS